MPKRWLAGIPLVVIAIYCFGPNPSTPVFSQDLPMVPSTPTELNNYVLQNEWQHKLKPDNQARIIWADDSMPRKTPYAIVYLHGFSSSQAEGDPIHRDIAKKFHCNLYLSRLADHGIDSSDPLIGYTAEKSWSSAKEAFAIGKQLGEKVIIMGTSTGGTLALMLAAAYPDLYSLVLLSPNIRINGPFASLLNNPWGLQIARQVLGSNFIHSKDQRPVYKQYWYSMYRAEAAVQLEELLETTMHKETFRKVNQPTLSLYYYQDEIHQDSVVRVSAIIEMMKELGTPLNRKRSLAIPTAGDHVLGSYIKSKDLSAVESAIEKFMVEVLQISEFSEQ